MTNSIQRWLSILAIGSLLALGIEGTLLLRELRIKTDLVAGEVAGWNVGVQKSLGATSAAMLTLAQVGAKERNAFDAQNKYFTDLSAHTIPLFDSANQTIVKLGNAADQIATVAPTANTAITKLTDDAGSVATGLAPSIENMNAGTAALAADVSDPAIHQAFAHANGVSSNMDAASHDVAAFVHRETTPVRGTWNVIKAFLREFAGPAAQVTTAIR